MSAEQLTDQEQQDLSTLTQWLEDQVRRIRLPDLLIEVDNELRFSRHFFPDKEAPRTAEGVCQVVATLMAYGCNLGPQTMARLTRGVTYKQIKRVTDWQLHEDVLRAALADVVNAISKLDTARVWGEARTSSSDGQRFLFPRRSVKRTYSHRLSDYALEFYSFITDNYAPFYITPTECAERDAAYVLDGLLYHEADIDPEEHRCRYARLHGDQPRRLHAVGKQPELRRRVRQGLLKSEELHALARSVFYGKLGRADWRDFQRQMSAASCLLQRLFHRGTQMGVIRTEGS